MFARDFRPEIRQELLRGALTIYPAAFEAAQAFSKETAAWYQPLHRHALMRDTAVAVGQRANGVSVSFLKTIPPTTTYVELASGGSTLTIATSVTAKDELPRWAKHRASKAARFNGDLFDEIPPADGAYAILLCGPEVHFGAVSHAPAFVEIGIPASDYNAYIFTQSLFDEFPRVVSEVLGSTPTEIAEAYIQMRRRQAEGGGRVG